MESGNKRETGGGEMAIECKCSLDAAPLHKRKAGSRVTRSVRDAALPENQPDIQRFTFNYV